MLARLHQIAVARARAREAVGRGSRWREKPIGTAPAELGIEPDQDRLALECRAQLSCPHPLHEQRSRLDGGCGDGFVALGLAFPDARGGT